MIMAVRSIVLFIALTALAGCERPGETEDRAGAPPEGGTGFLDREVRVNGSPTRYALYVPDNYTAEKRWPLIIFLHGSGERGTDNLKQTEVGLGRAIRLHRERFPALVLLPQCPDGRFWDAATPAIEAALAEVREAYAVDPKAITLTGLSLGGYATWIWGAQKADTFAALMPVCGGGEPADVVGPDRAAEFGTMEARVEALSKIPIWAFHGGADDVVPPERTRAMVERVRAAGGEARYDELPGVGHNSWDAAYGNEAAIAWLLAQRKP